MTILCIGLAMLVVLEFAVIASLVSARIPRPEVSLESGTLAPPEVLRRLFAEDDWQYVSANGSRDLVMRFERERSRIAMEWLTEIRIAMSVLWSEHRKAAGTSEGFAPAMEIRLMGRFSLFWAASMVASMLVAANQVFAMRQAVASTARWVDAMSANLRLQLMVAQTA